MLLCPDFTLYSTEYNITCRSSKTLYKFRRKFRARFGHDTVKTCSGTLFWLNSNCNTGRSWRSLGSCRPYTPGVTKEIPHSQVAKIEPFISGHAGEWKRDLIETHLRGGSRGRVQGVRAPTEMKLSSYLILKFVYLTGQWRHSLEVHPLLRKILDLPCTCPRKTQYLTIKIELLVVKSWLVPLALYNVSTRQRLYLLRAESDIQQLIAAPTG